jgi:Zn-dependent M28 family amino/carboxypeptidase
MPLSILSQNFSEYNEKRVTRLQQDIITLASDEMEGREPGTNGEIKARDYIISRMQEIGLNPKGTDGFIQAFTYFEDEVAVLAHNVIGSIDNNAKKTVVITAHYDHLGYGESGSMYEGPRQIHNGADDNASGTAALLELAHLIKNNKIKEDNNFLFIAFSAEEKGLLGSKYYVMNPSLNLNEINYVLNMDMLGRMEPGMALTIEGVGSSLIWESSLKEIKCDAFPLTLKKRENGPSDHAPFYDAGIPALHFWTGKHDDYHKPSDDAEKINFNAESEIISFIETLILSTDSKGKINFHLRKK